MVDIDRLHKVALSSHSDKGGGDTWFKIACIKGVFDLDCTAVLCMCSRAVDIKRLALEVIRFFDLPKKDISYYIGSNPTELWLYYDYRPRTIGFVVVPMYNDIFVDEEQSIGFALRGYDKDIPIVDFRREWLEVSVKPTPALTKQKVHRRFVDYGEI